MTYSLWLKPEQHHTDRLQHRIKQLARRHISHRFTPHVTLCSNIQNKPSTGVLAALANRHAKLSLVAVNVQHSSNHYRCLTLALRRDQTLCSLRTDALHALNAQRKVAPYNPHISLLYAKLSPAHRQALSRQVPAELLRHCTGDTLQLVWTEGTEALWHVVEQHPLGRVQ